MLTIFAAPKPFRGHTAVIQRNAIRSWTLLRPACDVVLLGNEAGIAEVAAEHGVRHIPEVERTASGTPLISGLFRQAERTSDREVFCYVNSDIILMSDFIAAIQRVVAMKRRFLLVGHRWNLDVTSEMAFELGLGGAIATAHQCAWRAGGCSLHRLLRLSARRAGRDSAVRGRTAALGQLDAVSCSLAGHSAD